VKPSIGTHYDLCIYIYIYQEHWCARTKQMVEPPIGTQYSYSMCVYIVYIYAHWMYVYIKQHWCVYTTQCMHTLCMYTYDTACKMHIFIKIDAYTQNRRWSPPIVHTYTMHTYTKSMYYLPPFFDPPFIWYTYSWIFIYNKWWILQWQQTLHGVCICIHCIYT